MVFFLAYFHIVENVYRNVYCCLTLDVVMLHAIVKLKPLVLKECVKILYYLDCGMLMPKYGYQINYISSCTGCI